MAATPADAGDGSTAAPDVLVLRLSDLALLDNVCPAASNGSSNSPIVWLDSQRRDAVASAAKYRASKPLVPGCRAWHLGSQQYGVVSSVVDGAAGEIAALSWCMGNTHELSGDTGTAPATELATGSPLCTLPRELGASLGSLTQGVVWSWPEHLEPSDIAFRSIDGKGARGDTLDLATTPTRALITKDEKSLFSAFHHHPYAHDAAAAAARR